MLRDCINTNNNKRIMRIIEVRLFRMAYAWTHDIDIANYLARVSSRSLYAYQKHSCMINWVTVYTCLYKHCRSTTLNGKSMRSACVYPLASKQDRHLHQLLQSLPLLQRVAITLVDIADMGYEEVSFILEKDIKTVKHWISVARFKMLTGS